MPPILPNSLTANHKHLPLAACERWKIHQRALLVDRHCLLEFGDAGQEVRFAFGDDGLAIVYQVCFKLDGQT